MPRLAYTSKDGTLRVVERDDGRAVVELADGGDALGGTRWVKAIIQPDRYGNGVVYLEGWAQIAGVLGVSEDTALEYSRLAVDPLPTRTTPRGMKIIADPLARAWWANRTLPERIYPYLANEVSSGSRSNRAAIPESRVKSGCLRRTAENGSRRSTRTRVGSGW